MEWPSLIFVAFLEKRTERMKQLAEGESRKDE